MTTNIILKEKLEKVLSSNIKIIEIPTELFPLEVRALNFWENLFHSIKELSQLNDGALVFLQNESAVIQTQSWLDELQEKLILADLGERIIFVRHVIALLKTSKFKSFYICRSSNFGFYLDLSWACSYCLSFNQNALFGYPEIQAGSFPCGGRIESDLKSKKYTQSFWAKESVVTAQRALELDWIDFLGDTEKWEEQSLSWIERVFKRNTTSSMPVSDLTVEAAGKFERRDDFETETIQSTNTYVSQDGGYVDYLYHSWDACWRVIQSQQRERSEEQKEQLLVYFCARHYLGASYRVWCDRESWRFDEDQRRHKHYQQQIEDSSLHVLLSESLVPPARPLARLLKRGYQIILVADHPEGLRTNLELLYGRLERLLPIEEAQKLWHERISWTVSSKMPPHNQMRLTWNADDQVMIYTSPETSQLFLRIEGNKGGAASGWCEYTSDHLDLDIPPRVLNVIHAMSNGIIPARAVGPLKVPVTVFMRSAMLEMIIDYACSLGGNIHNVLDALRHEGWGFIASQASWDYFLIHREGTFSVNPETLKIGPKFLRKDIWELGHWKSALSYVSANRKNAAWTLSSAELSLHFAIYAGLLASSLVQFGYVRNPQEADRLVLTSIGFPQRFGTPLGCLRMQGVVRVRYLAQIYWPDFKHYGEVMSHEAPAI